MNPDSTISAIRPSMIALVSTTMCGSPVGGSSAPRPGGRRMSPIGLGGDQQVVSLGDRQPEHPEPEEERDAERQPRPERRRASAPAAGRAAGPSAGRAAARRPRSRTRRSRAARPGGSASVAGTTVRYGRIAKPTTIQATTHSGEQRPPVGVRSRGRGRRRSSASASPTSPPSAAPRTRILRINGSLAACLRRRRATSRSASGRGRQPSIARHGARHAPRDRRRAPAAIASASVATATISIRRPRRPTAGRGPERGTIARPKPEPGGLAQPALEPGDGAQLAEQADLADRDRARSRPAGRAATTRARGPAAGRGPARRRPARRRGSRRRRGRRGRRRPAGRGRRAAGRARFGSRPLAVRRGGRTRAGATSAWTSTSSGRLPSSVGATTLPGRRLVVVGEERPRRVGDLGEAALAHLEDADLLRRPEAVLRWRAAAAATTYRSPSRLRTASTRCSRVFGPAIEPSFVTCPARMTAIPSPFASSISRSVDSRTWPTLPAGPSRSSTIAVWTESTTSTAGGSARAALDHPADRRSRRGSGSRPPAGRRRAGRGAPPAGGPAAPTPRRWHRARRRSARRRPGRPSPGAAASTCRSPARHRAGRATRHQPAAEDAVELADPDRAARDGRLRDVVEGAWRSRRPEPGRVDARPARSARRRDRTRVSTRLFQPPQARHWPSQRRKASPQLWQT